MARILVVGGAGYVGSHCCKAVAAAGHDCIVFDNLSSGHREFVRWGPLVAADIRNADALATVFATERIDAVMHFAALAYVGESVTAPGKYYDVNVAGTRTLLDAMVRAKVPAIVFSSSCAVYGEPATQPITERTVPRPINPYGRTKLICEDMLGDFGVAHGVRSMRLRYFNAAGCDPDGDIGEDHAPETHLIPLVLDAAIGRRAEIAVFGSDYATADGTAVRDYVHVSDLATAHVAALSRLLSGGDSLSINLGTGAGASVQDVIDTARRVTGRSIAVRKVARRAGDPATLVADAGEARRVLGWSPRRSGITDVVSDAWRWHETRFGKPGRN